MAVSQMLATKLIPIFADVRPPEFNTIAVLRHGTHEKNLSNLFAWLLDPGGSHRLGNQFAGIFIKHVNARDLFGRTISEYGPWLVEQEVNVSEPLDSKDIADISLSTGTTAVVIENYHVSDGHGHSYDKYFKHGQRLIGEDPNLVPACSSNSFVVLLCQYVDKERQDASGWKDASVVTYAALITDLIALIESEPEYRLQNENAYGFLKQVESYFIRGEGMPRAKDLTDFVAALCDANESVELVSTDSEAFADRMRDEAALHFDESRRFLNENKSQLRDYARRILTPQLLNHLKVRDAQVSIGMSGVYQWTVNIDMSLGTASVQAEDETSRLQLKFGPSAHFAITHDPEWKGGWATDISPDYSKVFVTWDRTIYQTDVSMTEIGRILTEQDPVLAHQVLEIFASRFG